MKQSFDKKSIFKLFTILCLSFLPASYLYALNPGELRPVLEKKNLYQLQDRIYYFPANYSPDSKTVILPLRRWDLIFTGDHINPPDSDSELENVNNLIPGPFNHMMVYMGKDALGLAYAIELNVMSLEKGGVLSLICLGSDFGFLRHPDTIYLQDKGRMTHRWALRFVDSAYELLHANESILFARLHTDLLEEFPYQFEIQHSGSLLDPYIHLVDDGFKGGAGCSDYWTTLFEEYAGLCLKNVRLSAEQAEVYFRNDYQGRLAYVPKEFSPFNEPVFVWQILNMGFQAIEDEPHVYTCDGTEQSGLVLPSFIMQSDQLEEILPLNLPVPASRFPGFR